MAATAPAGVRNSCANSFMYGLRKSCIVASAHEFREGSYYLQYKGLLGWNADYIDAREHGGPMACRVWASGDSACKHSVLHNGQDQSIPFPAVLTLWVLISFVISTNLGIQDLHAQTKYIKSSNKHRILFCALVSLPIVQYHG